MPIPDFQSLMPPMPQLAADGWERRLSDAVEALAQQFGLTEAEREELLPSGVQRKFDNRVGWARTHLGKALLLESSKRGWFRITERGRAVLAQNPVRIDMAFLSQYPEYQAFRSRDEAAENGAVAAGETAKEVVSPGETLEASYQASAARSRRSCWRRSSSFRRASSSAWWLTCWLRWATAAHGAMRGGPLGAAATAASTEASTRTPWVSTWSTSRPNAGSSPSAGPRCRLSPAAWRAPALARASFTTSTFS